MWTKYFLLVVLISAAAGDGEVTCMDSAYCSLIKGDIAKVSDKYGKDPGKYYKEAQDYLAKGMEYNATKTESIKQECQSSHKVCSDEAFTMAVEGLTFPAAMRGKCNFEAFSRTIFGCMNLKDWPADVRKALSVLRVDCRTECFINATDKYTLNNGKILSTPAPREDYNMTVKDVPADLEPRYRLPGEIHKELDSNRMVVEWISGFGDTDIKGRGWGHLDPCPGSSFVRFVDNFKASTRNAANNPLFHIDVLCEGISFDKQFVRVDGHILSKYVGNIRVFTGGRSNTTAGTPFPEYDTTKEYTFCPGLNFIIGISLTRKTYLQGTVGIEYVNVLCGSSQWQNRGSQVDSDQMVCKTGHAICGIQTKIGLIKTQYAPSDTIVDVRVACCSVPVPLLDLTINIVGLGKQRDLTPAPVNPPPVTPLPVNPVPGTPPPVNPVPVTPPPVNPVPVTPPPVNPVPVTPPPVNPVPVTPPPVKPGTVNPEQAAVGDDGLYNLQKKFLLVWGQIHNQIITSYYYYYTPNTLDKEKEWETTKCADGTFVNSFEVTTPVSIYHWTRRIMQIKFKCDSADGSKSNELDLYKKLLTKGFVLQNPDPTQAGSKDCKGGQYTAMKINYYEDKTRTKIALVNAWELTMTCSKGGTTEPHSHLINSTPENIVTDNFIDSGMVDCGAGKAICGFTHKLAAENAKGAYEGVFFKLVCCSV